MAGLTVDVVTVAYERGAAFALGVADGRPEMFGGERGGSESLAFEGLVRLRKRLPCVFRKIRNVSRIEKGPGKTGLKALHTTRCRMEADVQIGKREG